MGEAVDDMRRYFTREAWLRWGARYFNDWPGPWGPLFREMEASLDVDPSSDRAQALLARSIALWNQGVESDARLHREVREGYGRAWADREQWPAELKRRYADFRIQEIGGFLGRASWESARRRGLVQTYTSGTRSIA